MSDDADNWIADNPPCDPAGADPFENGFDPMNDVRIHRKALKEAHAALRHALTFIENRHSDLSPEKRSVVAHIRAALTLEDR